MPTLWSRFSTDVSLPQKIDAAARQRLADVFSSDKKSPWAQALKLLGLKPSAADMLFWHGEVPYFNWSEMARLVTANMVELTAGQGGMPVSKTTYGFFSFLKFLSIQWRTVKFLETPKPLENPLVESLFLGLCFEMLQMGLKAEDRENIPKWLSGAVKPPRHARKSIQQMQWIQKRRTEISSAWKNIWQAGDVFYVDGVAEGLPEYFWDTPDNPVILPTNTTAKLLPASGGVVTGYAVVVRSYKEDRQKFIDLKTKMNAKLILVFRHARPESVDFYDIADGLIFCTGGVLSHACTVAREMNIPAVTDAGDTFLDQLGEGNWIVLDGTNGLIKPV